MLFSGFSSPLSLLLETAKPSPNITLAIIVIIAYYAMLLM